MANAEPSFAFTKLGRKSEYSVFVQYPDGRKLPVGKVNRFFIRHLDMEGWEATGANGEHRAVHHTRWQAAGALVADLANYPFPTIKRGV